VIIRSDHANLRWINNTSNPTNRRQYGLLLKTTKFNYIVKHVPGKKNPADALSRLPQHRVDESHLAPQLKLNLAETAPLTIQTLAATTIPETLRRRYLEDLENDEDGQEMLLQDPLPEDWTLEKGILCFKDKIYVLSNTRVKVLDLLHDNSGHPGIEKTHYAVAKLFHWPGLSSFIKEYVRGCQHCPQIKHSTHRPYGLLQPHPAPEGPWTRVGIDFITGLPLTKNGHNTIMTVSDHFTKMLRLIPTLWKGLTAEKTAILYKDHVSSLFGMPSTWITDRGQ
jgi:hypothetical protein